MAIKPRRPQPTAEEIEAFGAAADAAQKPPTTEAPTAPTPSRGGDAPTPAAPVARTVPAATRGQWPVGLARTLTIRYPDPVIPQLLAELAELDDRSQHNTALRALRRGLDELKRETGLG